MEKETQNIRDNDMKTCSRCKKNLSIELFGKNRSRKDGLMIYCKECTNKPVIRPKKKVCEICQKEKPIKNFLNEDTNRVSKYCHSCLPRYDLNRYYKQSREDPEKFKTYHREYKQKYRAKNKEKYES